MIKKIQIFWPLKAWNETFIKYLPDWSSPDDPISSLSNEHSTEMFLLQAYLMNIPSWSLCNGDDVICLAELKARQEWNDKKGKTLDHRNC